MSAVLVTGAAGLLGRFVVDEMLRRSHRVRGFDRFAGGEVPGQTQQARIPADADGARAVLIPTLVVDVGRVFQGELRLTVRRASQADLDPADVAAELPGSGEGVGFVAALDRPAGIALELVIPAEPEVAADRQEPARDALSAGAGFPEVVDGGVVGLADGRDPGFAGLEPATTHHPLDAVDLRSDVDHLRLSRFKLVHRNRRMRLYKVEHIKG